VLAETDDNGANCVQESKTLKMNLNFTEIQEIPDTLDDDEEDLSAIGMRRISSETPPHSLGAHCSCKCTQKCREESAINGRAGSLNKFC
jgi:hypothetical protein